MSYKSICGHQWEPIEGHERRFRCKWCGAIGYIRTNPPGANRPHNKIYVYRCDVKGCFAPAVVVHRLGRTVVFQRCERHKGERDGQG
jgi:hypothetical protein